MEVFEHEETVRVFAFGGIDGWDVSQCLCDGGINGDLSCFFSREGHADFFGGVIND